MVCAPSSLSFPDTPSGDARHSSHDGIVLPIQFLGFYPFDVGSKSSIRSFVPFPVPPMLAFSVRPMLAPLVPPMLAFSVRPMLAPPVRPMLALQRVMTGGICPVFSVRMPIHP